MHVHRVGRGLVVGRGEHARGRQKRKTTCRGQAGLLSCNRGLLALLAIRVSVGLRVLALVVLVRGLLSVLVKDLLLRKVIGRHAGNPCLLLLVLLTI